MMTDSGGKNKSYFEGWYFKHQTKENTISFIPGINLDERGGKFAFIQVITDKESFVFDYMFDDFRMQKAPLAVRIKDNIFTEKGITVDMQDKYVKIKGKIEYGRLTPVKRDIMGPFRFLPFMECRHGVISLFHTARGELPVNGQVIKMRDDTGYIEKDWGRSFPKKYLWTQCSDDKNGACSVMISVADIPYAGMCFKGCICSVYCGGKEYRLATYKGVKIIDCGSSYLELRQGKYRLIVDLKESEPQKLLAPVNGNMNRIIHENTSCTARYLFYEHNKLLLDLNSDRASFEFVE
jgi:hypothetical protein